MVNEVKCVLLKHPKDAFQSQNKCDKESKKLNYSKSPNFNLAVAQYDSFVKLIESFGSDICYLPGNKNTTLDSIYTHDPFTMVNDGLILCNMGKFDRSTEPVLLKNFFNQLTSQL